MRTSRTSWTSDSGDLIPLPGYYIPWTSSQLTALDKAFAQMSERIQARWRSGQKTYVRNLFTWAPTPFFNTGLVVDADRTIHPSNVGLSGALDHLRSETSVGSLDDPLGREALRGAYTAGQPNPGGQPSNPMS